MQQALATFTTSIQNVDGVPTLILTINAEHLNTFFAADMREKTTRERLHRELSVPEAEALIIELPVTKMAEQTATGVLLEMRRIFLEAHKLPNGRRVHVHLPAQAEEVRRLLELTSTGGVLVPLTTCNNVGRPARKPRRRNVPE